VRVDAMNVSAVHNTHVIIKASISLLVISDICINRKQDEPSYRTRK